MFAALKPLLFALDPEAAHNLTLAALKTGLVPAAPADDPILATTMAGLALPNPIGLAAGFDKDAYRLCCVHGASAAKTYKTVTFPSLVRRQSFDYDLICRF